VARHMNIDELPSANEAVTFTLGGKIYTITDYSREMYGRVLAIEEEGQASNQNPGAIHAKQLAMMTGQPEEEFLVVNDLRKTAAAIGFAMGAIIESADAATNRKKPRR